MKPRRFDRATTFSITWSRGTVNSFEPSPWPSPLRGEGTLALRGGGTIALRGDGTPSGALRHLPTRWGGDLASGASRFLPTRWGGDDVVHRHQSFMEFRNVRDF